MRLKKRTVAGLAALLICHMLLPQGLGAQTGGGRLVDDAITSPALAANLLGDATRRAVTVYLPPQYDRELERRFPVVYLLHGFKAKNRLWTGEGQPGRGLQVQELADDLINRGVIQPLVIVMPDASNAYGGSFYRNSQVTGNWEDFICQDLVGYIDGAYRTIPQAWGRGLAGHSMGGYGAFLVGLRHPGIFSAVYALSPACLVFSEHFLKLQKAELLAAARLTDRSQFPDLDWRRQVVIAAAAAMAPNPKNPPWLADFPLTEADGQPMLNEAVWQRWLNHDPYTLLESLRANLPRLKLAFDMGSADRLISQSRLLHEALERLGHPHTYEEYQGDHASHLRERLQERALPFFSRALVEPGSNPAGP